MPAGAWIDKTSTIENIEFPCNPCRNPNQPSCIFTVQDLISYIWRTKPHPLPNLCTFTDSKDEIIQKFEKYVHEGSLVIDGMRKTTFTTPLITPNTVSYGTPTEKMNRPVSRTDVAGSWKGYWQYDGNTVQYPFTINLQQSNGILTGTIREPGSSVYLNAQYADSTLKGSISGTSVRFVKTYYYDGHEVIYTGVYNPSTKQISGRWNIGPSWGGAFVINTN